MTHRRSKWPTRTIEIDPVEMQSVSFPSSETLPRDESLVSGLLWAGADLFTIDWTSEAASLHVRETSWLLVTASLSAQLLITLLSISRRMSVIARNAGDRDTISPPTQASAKRGGNAVVGNRCRCLRAYRKRDREEDREALHNL
jgi:hypothetical protein